MLKAGADFNGSAYGMDERNTLLNCNLTCVSFINLMSALFQRQSYKFALPTASVPSLSSCVMFPFPFLLPLPLVLLVSSLLSRLSPIRPHLLPPPSPCTTTSPSVVLLLLLDRLIPLRTHTPCETPPATKTLIPSFAESPCTLCNCGISLGMVTRTLPCSHTFHASCLDRYCLAHSQITCPMCPLRLPPVPDPNTLLN